jgi:hypothetical protein
MGKRPIKYFLILIIVTSVSSDFNNSHDFRKTTLWLAKKIYSKKEMPNSLEIYFPNKKHNFARENLRFQQITTFAEVQI